MNSELAWNGKYARIIKTGELVEVISYDATSLQVKTPDGYTASLSINDVHPAASMQEVAVLKKIQVLKDKLEATAAQSC